ncbi:MAG: butyrate kinase [Bacteroidota bacterium]
MDANILVINPGSTSTKIAVYSNRKEVLLLNVKHPHETLAQFERIADQLDFRKNKVREVLEGAEIDIGGINMIVGRGGLLKPMEGGAYRVNEKLVSDMQNPMGEHESNLGGVIAWEFAKEIGGNVVAMIVDPTCVDELDDIARISGMPELPRRSLLHALNQKAIARTFAQENKTSYDEINVIVAHMGGGISVGAHSHGRIIDVNNGLDGDGPMSPERSGGLPVGQLVDLCFSGKFTRDEIRQKIKGQGGMFAYLGTTNAVEVEKRIREGDAVAKQVYMAIAYQVAKEIGALGTVCKGHVDGILITGGLAYSDMLVDDITERVKHIAPVKVYPGEGEMKAMAMNAFMVFNGDIELKDYR